MWVLKQVLSMITQYMQLLEVLKQVLSMIICNCLKYKIQLLCIYPWEFIVNIRLTIA